MIQENIDQDLIDVNAVKVCHYARGRANRLKNDCTLVPGGQSWLGGGLCLVFR